jgi:PEST, proteolytic signal-containing nuclear protein family
LDRRGYRNRSRDKGETSQTHNEKNVVAPPPPKLSSPPQRVSLNLKPGTPGLLRPGAGFGVGKKGGGIQMKLNQPAVKEPAKKITVAKAFNNDESDDNEEEVSLKSCQESQVIIFSSLLQMPKEARMRMRNIGRETPTSSGPNSFGKTKHGFCDAKKIFEKSLRSLTE